MTRPESQNVSDECAMAYCHEPPFETSRWCRKHRDYYGQDSGTRPDGDEREQSPSGQQGATSAADQGDRTPSGAAPASLAASNRGLSEEIESSTDLWEVRWLSFNQGAPYDLVNAEIARVAAGWEPFATLAQPGGWVLLLKRHAAAA